MNDQEKPEVQRLILPCPHWHPEAREATDSLVCGDTGMLFPYPPSRTVMLLTLGLDRGLLNPLGTQRKE